MFNISSFFDKFKSLELQDFKRRAVVIDTIKKYTKIDVPPEKIRFEQTRIVLGVSSIEKNEIFIKKSVILAEIRTLLNPSRVDDIV